ncbi:WD40-repeat-containing domain protein [Epithele typhae]|uniref:WD40-repeat-containing domain protein n=1 Tax=Epithele typhae TaxID=378194 RepID=UPI0020072B64|nr:WD40-repeat-containing domain protein [Epithele typhae]KAH9928029.1 WD40-repeat-containing domain protein [Epithele typhae]
MPSSPPVPVEIWEAVVDVLGAGHEFESVAVCARVCTQWLPRSRLHIWREVYLNTIDQLASVRHALECTPQLRGLVASVHLHLFPAPMHDPALFNSAPVVLLPYLPCVEVWRFEVFWAFGMPGFRAFSRFPGACFRKCSSIKTLELKNVHLPSPLHLYRLVACFPKLQNLRLAAVKFTDELALPGSRTSIASLQELKMEDLYMKEQEHLRPLHQTSATTLTRLTLPCAWLPSRDIGEMTRLQYLALRCDRQKPVLSSCIIAAEKVNIFLCHGLPSSLITFEVVYPEAICPPQKELDDVNRQESEPAARLVEDLGRLRKIGATCIFEDVKENHVDRCTSVVEQAFLSLHSSNLLRVFRTFTHPPVKRLYGHTDNVERLVLSPSGAWAASISRCKSPGWSASIIIWNTESEKLVFEQWYNVSGFKAISISFASTEALCACTNPSSGVDLFRLPSRSDVAAGQRLRKVGCFKVGHDDDHVDHAWRPDGTQLVVLTRLGSLEVWDAITLALVQSFPSPRRILQPRVIDFVDDPSSIQISNDGRFVLHVCKFTPKPGKRHRCIFVHDLVTGICHSPFPSPDAPATLWFAPITHVVLRSDPARPHVQQVVVVRDDAPIVMLADVGTDSSLGGPVSLTLDIEPTQPHRGLLFHVSANGHRVLHTHGTAVSTTYSVFDVGTGRPVATVLFRNALQGNRRGMLSPDGRHGVLLASSYGRYKMWLWHVDEGTLHRIQGTMGCREWTAAEFSGDGATLGLGYSDGTVSFHIVQDVVRGQA